MFLFTTPVFKETIWGGKKLEEFDFEIPSDHTGEAWVIAAHPNGNSVIRSGEYEGRTLADVYRLHPELFGASGELGAKFPLLIKIIDAREDLSIQVHPDDAYAYSHENGSFGKTECWYVLDCEENASIVIGHNAKDHEDLVRMVREERWSDLIREIPVHPGDFFLIRPGTVHAIKGGTLILETQQNSDVTYRVYDYDRLQNGQKRPLHIEQSLDVITAPYEAPEVPDYRGQGRKITTGAEVWHLADSDYFGVDKIRVDGRFIANYSVPFLNLTVIEGEGEIDGEELKKGDSLIITNKTTKFRLEGKLTAIVSWPVKG